MAYAVGDEIVWGPVGIASGELPTRGLCVVLGANPEIVWLRPQGVARIVMTGFGPNVSLGNMLKVVAPTPAEVQTWQFKRVNPTGTIIPNTNGMAQGVVIQVWQVSESALAPFLAVLVKTDAGLYYIAAAAVMNILPT